MNCILFTWLWLLSQACFSFLSGRATGPHSSSSCQGRIFALKSGMGNRRGWFLCPVWKAQTVHQTADREERQPYRTAWGQRPQSRWVAWWSQEAQGKDKSIPGLPQIGPPLTLYTLGSSQVSWGIKSVGWDCKGQKRPNLFPPLGKGCLLLKRMSSSIGT